MRQPKIDNFIIKDIIERYSDIIMRIAYHHIGNLTECEDIMQDVFVSLIKKYPFNSEEHMKAWIIRVTINKCKNYMKSSYRKTLPLPEHSNIAVMTDSSNEVMEEIMLLPETERDVIYLHYYEGYTAKEIGKMIGKSENAVHIILTRARNRLKLLIDGETSK